MNATIVDLRYRMKDKSRLMPISSPLGVSDKGTSKTADQPLFGLWKDRDDLTGPAFWLRSLRQPRAILSENGIKRQRTARKLK